MFFTNSVKVCVSFKMEHKCHQNTQGVLSKGCSIEGDIEGVKSEHKRCSGALLEVLFSKWNTKGVPISC